MENQGLTSILLLTAWTAVRIAQCPMTPAVDVPYAVGMCPRRCAHTSNRHCQDIHTPVGCPQALVGLPVAAGAGNVHISWDANLQVAGAKRDYELGSADYDFWNVRAPVMSAIRSAALTWVRSLMF
jgi:hypothetical protein